MTMALQEAICPPLASCKELRKRAASHNFGPRNPAGGQCPHFASIYLCQPRLRTPPKSQGGAPPPDSALRNTAIDHRFRREVLAGKSGSIAALEIESLSVADRIGPGDFHELVVKPEDK